MRLCKQIQESAKDEKRRNYKKKVTDFALSVAFFAGDNCQWSIYPKPLFLVYRFGDGATFSRCIAPYGQAVHIFHLTAHSSLKMYSFRLPSVPICVHLRPSAD